MLVIMWMLGTSYRYMICTGCR